MGGAESNAWLLSVLQQYQTPALDFSVPITQAAARATGPKATVRAPERQGYIWSGASVVLAQQIVTRLTS